MSGVGKRHSTGAAGRRRSLASSVIDAPLPSSTSTTTPLSGHLVDRKAFSLSGWCRLCAMLLSDVDYTLEDGMMHEGVGSA